MIVGTEANEADLECHPRVREGVGGRKLPPSPNLWEVVIRRRMKMRKRGR
jgi:hypothetical protein